MVLQYLYQIQGISLKRVLEINDYSPVYIRNNEWKYHYVITKILNKRRYSTLPNGWVRLNIEHLRQVLGSSSDKEGSFRFIDRIRKDFKQWGLIKTKYELHESADGSKIKICYAKVLDEYTARGWRKWTPNKHIKLKPMATQKLTGIYAKLQRSLSLVAIDYAGANAFALNALQKGMKLPPKLTEWKPAKYRVVDEQVYSSWCMAIDLIKLGVYNVKVEFKSSGRVYTAISNFPRLLRHYLTLNGKRLIGLDCANSQPLLFAAYLKLHYQLTPDMLKYIELCERGELYEYVTELLISNGCVVPASRKEFKVEFFAKLFYSKEKKRHQWRTVFASEFPNVAAAISEAKKVTTKGGGTPSLLTTQLSLIESEIMIKGVARRLYEGGITEFVTLHDCILTTEEHTDVVYSLIAEEYQKYGVKPTIKIEN